MDENFQQHKKKALQIILLFGVVSLLGDIVYEGARSVNGPYLKILGASAAMVGFVGGLGEFLGYALRLISGYFSDKAKSYWLFVFLGYGMLVSVPFLAFAGMWEIAACLIVLERVGKALRSPAKDTILSHASQPIGTGWAFGLHEAMDQIGAVAGPLIFSFAFFSLRSNEASLANYQTSYSFLWIPFVLLLFCIFLAYRCIPDPTHFSEVVKKTQPQDRLSRVFWIYTFFTFITTLGFANFILLGYHFKTTNLLSDSQIPLFYALAMGLDAVVALAIGKIYDVLQSRKPGGGGLDTLILIPLLSLGIPICGFSSSFSLALLGVLLWGMVMGLQETIMRSAISDLTPLKKRGTGYGIFNTSYGLGMFLGSLWMGILYDSSWLALIVVSIGIQVFALVVFLVLRKEVLVQSKAER